jgi:hypothetical protein
MSQGACFLFPASGNRNYSNGALAVLGLNGYAWSSSPSGVNGRNLGFNAPGVNPANTTNRSYGLPVRCVKNLTRFLPVCMSRREGLGFSAGFFFGEISLCRAIILKQRMSAPLSRGKT